MIKKDVYIVGSDSKILMESECAECIDRFTDDLCDKYEAEHDGSHEVYLKREGKYFYSHSTYFGGNGLTSRGVHPRPDQTEHFLKKYKFSVEKK